METKDQVCEHCVDENDKVLIEKIVNPSTPYSASGQGERFELYLCKDCKKLVETNNSDLINKKTITKYKR